MTLKYDVKGRGTSSEAVAAVDKLHAGQLGPSWNAQKPETLAAQVLPAPPRGKKLEGLLEKPPDFSNEVIFAAANPLERFRKAQENRINPKI